MLFDLRPHQEASLARMHNGCILCGGTGSGKSLTAVYYYLNNEAPKTVYVITSAKKRDTHDWQMLFGDVGMTSNPEVTPGALVYVDSWENIKKYEEVTDAFFIFDEQRLVGSGRWVKAFYKIAAANNWVMLSATPGDNWLDYVPVFRANGFIKNLTQFKEDHVVSRWTGRYYQVLGYRQVGRLVRWRNQLLVDMPYEKHTTRHTHEVAVEYDKDLIRELVNKRWHVYEKRPLTDASELFRVMRKVVYSDSSRLRAVERLLQTHPKLIVFYSFNYELEMLRTLNIPPTQIMKMPNGIVQVGPSSTLRPSDSSAPNISTPSRSTTLSPEKSSETAPSTTTRSLSQKSSPLESSGPATHSMRVTDSEPQTTSGELTEDPWDYLLSPEGMSLNGSLVRSTRTPRSSEATSEIQDRWGNTHHLTQSSASTSRDSSASNSTTGSGDSSTSWSTRDTALESTGTTSASNHQESETDPCVEVAESNDPSTTKMEQDPASTNSCETHEQSSDTSTASPATSTESQPGGHPLTPDGSSSSNSTNSEVSQKTNFRPLQRVPSSDGLNYTTTVVDDSSPTAGNTSSDSDAPAETETEWQTKHDPTQTKSSPTTTTEKESRSSGTQPSGTRSERSTSLSEVSPKTSTTRKSSQPSKTSPDPSGPGSASTSSPPFQVAEWNGHKHEDVPTTTSWVYLVQYVAGAEAWECITTDAMCFFSMPYSYKLWWQAYGRIDRLNTPFTDLNYYVLYGGSMLEKAVAQSLETKKSFNESAFAAEIGW